KPLRVGKYNAGQKLMFWGIMGLICALLLTGLVIWRAYFAHLFPIPVLRVALLLHAVAGVGLMLLTRRVWVASLVVGMLLLLGSFVNFYKITYRNDPLLPKDLLLAVDAAKVSAELSLRPSLPMGLFLLFIVLSVLVLFPVRSPFAQKGLKAFMARALLCLVPAALCGIYLKTTLWNKELQQNFGLDTSAFYPLETYQKAGFATAFLMYCGEMKPVMPQGYDEPSTLAAAAGLPLQNHAAQQRPDVIVVMLESYYRLDNVTGAVYDTDLTTNYDRYAKTGISGSYLSDKYSGGTEEMEFGALTGFSTSFLPTGSIAYMEYIRDDFPCYPRFLKENGYKTIALHPFDSTIYKRDESYPKMGFDV
ncbi:MAG: sulfatase-like hydrolase/transferase, partial [Pygmaiobacter sp.]